MPTARSKTLALICTSLVIVAGCASTPRRGSGGGFRTCVNAQACAPSAYLDSLEFGPAFPTVAQRAAFCKAPPDQPSFAGPIVVSDFSDGLSSDGRGPYVPGTVGVLGGGVAWSAGMGLVSPRKLLLNLSRPVPHGGGVPLGMIAVGDNTLPQWSGLHTQWRTLDNASQSLHDIQVGQVVTALQMNVELYIDGRFHILQMGPMPLGHCHDGTNLVTGAGTSSGTIYRSSATKWVVDLPAGSVGRLFDAHNTQAHAVDRGLYYVHLHYEIGK